MFQEEMHTILCDAVPFCFGPISKMLTISEQLSKKNRVSMLVSGTSQNLANKSHIDSLVECNTEDINDLKKQEMRIKTSDLYINIMNPVSAKFVKQKNTPQVQVDSLFWMWETIPQEILESEIYFIQNFEGVEKQLTKYFDKIKNPQLVGPIVKDPQENIKRQNKLLINFGGLESASIKIGKNSNYPFTIAKLLEKIETQLDFDEILCVGNGKIMSQLQEKNKSTKIKYDFLGHDEFIQELAMSKMLITSPGLTTSFEAFNSSTPTFFLPPQNYSQYWNLNGFKINGLAKESINWDSYADLKIIENEEEISGINKVLQGIKRFETDTNQQLKLADYLVNATKSNGQELKKVSIKQKKYFNKLGGNGTPKIIESINNLLEMI
ncbi:MAG: hypothetical protein WC915_04200 [archaeon]|jgi:hypothetical protein